MKQFIFLSKVLFLIIVFMKACFAFGCKDVVTNKTIGTEGGTSTLKVTINPQASDTNILVFDASTELQCQTSWTSGRAVDTLTLTKLTSDPVLNGLPSSATVLGSNYPLPSSEHVQLFKLDNVDGTQVATAFIPIQLYLDLSNLTANDIPIHKGDLLYTLTFKQTSSLGGSATYSWEVHAANDIVIVPSTCSINNNQIISVDFGSVQSTDIGTTSQNTNVKKNVNVDIKCDSTAMQSVGAEFVASAVSGFSSSNVVSTSMPELGVIFSQNGGELPLNQEAATEVPMSSGTGSLSFDVNIVKQDDATTLSGGDFTASATIVLTAE